MSQPETVTTDILIVSDDINVADRLVRLQVNVALVTLSREKGFPVHERRGLLDQIEEDTIAVRKYWNNLFLGLT